MKRILFVSFLLISFYTYSYAAVGCSLNDPDRDVKRVFPESTGYKTTFITLKEIGGEALNVEIEGKLGDRFDPIYENLDVPYAYYTVLKGKDIIGYIHGVNQKGKYGSLQLILALKPSGEIASFYYQRISSPESAKFRKETFTSKFSGLNLEDFENYDVLKRRISAGRLLVLVDPSTNNADDFWATLRGIKKNLILMEEFLKNKGGK